MLASCLCSFGMASDCKTWSLYELCANEAKSVVCSCDVTHRTWRYALLQPCSQVLCCTYMILFNSVLCCRLRWRFCWCTCSEHTVYILLMTTYYKKNSVSQFILALECLALFLPDINNLCIHNATVCIDYLNGMHWLIQRLTVSTVYCAPIVDSLFTCVVCEHVTPVLSINYA